MQRQREYSTFANNNRNWAGSVESNVVYRNYFRSNLKQERFSIGYRYTYNPDVRNYIQKLNEDEDYNRKTTGGLNEHTLMTNLLLCNSAKHLINIGATQVFRTGRTQSTFLPLNKEKKQSSDLTGNADNMNYTQNISALYVSYNGTISDKLSVNASL